MSEIRMKLEVSVLVDSEITDPFDIVRNLDLDIRNDDYSDMAVLDYEISDYEIVDSK